MAPFDKATVEFLQKPHFHRNLLNFVLGCIPSVYDNIAAMKKKVDKNPYNTRWDFFDKCSNKKIKK